MIGRRNAATAHHAFRAILIHFGVFPNFFLLIIALVTGTNTLSIVIPIGSGESAVSGTQ